MERRSGCCSRCVAVEDLRDPRADRRQATSRSRPPKPRRRARSTSSPATAVSRGSSCCGRTTTSPRPTTRTFAWHRPGESQLVAGTDKPLTVGPDTPFAEPAGQPPDDVLPGAATTRRTRRRRRRSTNLNGNNIISVASALQATSPSVIPMITIGGVDGRHRAGRRTPGRTSATPTASSVCSTARRRAPAACSRAPPTRTLYKAHYDAFSQLNRAANRSTTKSSYLTASSAAQFLGTNLAAKLQITPDGPRPATASTVRRRANVARHRPRVHRRGEGVQDGPDELGRAPAPCATIRTARSPTARHDASRRCSRRSSTAFMTDLTNDDRRQHAARSSRTTR